MDPVLALDQVEKSFGSVTAVRGVSFSVSRGECIGLLGPNGAGKSTLIRMIYGAASLSGGSMRVFGLDPMSQSRTIKKRLGVVTQDNALDEDMAVRANMLMYARCIGIPGAERAARTDRLLHSMSLAHRAEARIRELSGGMQRRLVFVRALLADPEMIILDEPTTGLDPAVRIHLWEEIRGMMREGKTILLTTHYMEEAERLCDRIVIVDQGKAQAIGSPKELISRYCPGTIAVFRYRKGLRSTLREAVHPPLHLFEDRTGFHLRGPDLPTIQNFLEKIGLEPDFIRPANLEDVFLEITGKELGEHA